MLVEDVIHLARYSELNSLSIKDNTPVIISFINLGLIELYKEFALSRSETVITLEEGKTIYDMPVDYMYPTIAFQKVKKGEEFINEDLPINNEQNAKSVFFPSFNKIQIPDTIDSTEITVVYVTKPPSYSMSTIQQELALPDVLIDCLLHFLGYKGHLGIRGDSQSDNNAYFKRFERSVFKAKEMGVSLSTDYYRETNKIVQKGFV